MSVAVWHAVEVTVSRAAREAVAYGLMEAGAVGTETNESTDVVCIKGYFAQPISEEQIRNVVREALGIYSLAVVSFDVRLSEFADQDWLAEWKKNWQPVEVGRFIIAPPWLVSEPGAVATGSSTRLSSSALAEASETSIVITINPGMAFGTGTHETTRLCLRAIDKYFRGGSFLDVGTGTGVLAIAAAKMCQKPDREGGLVAIRACDTDRAAIAIAKGNAELNNVADRIDFRVGTVDENTPSAELVCANLTAPVIIELLPLLLGATCGRLVLSGILDSQVEMAQSRLSELGAVPIEINRNGEWVAMIV